LDYGYADSLRRWRADPGNPGVIAGFPVTAGEWLSAHTWPRPDVGETTRQVLEFTVPEFADAAGVFVDERFLISGEPVTTSGGALALRRLGTRLSDDPRLADALFPSGEVVEFAAESPYGRCLSDGNPVAFARPDSQTLGRLRHEGRDIISRYRAFLAVPMTAHGMTIGLLAFARTPARPAFSETDTGIARQLAGRAATRVVNSRLLPRRRRALGALRQDLLPGDLAYPAGLEVAGRCLPADGLIGGDWYDVIPLTAGRTGLIVGDVMGHGIEAAATMAQLRAAAYGLAGRGITPAGLLTRLDRATVALNNADYATCLYAVVDAPARHATIALAGHLPPVIVMPDGAAHVPDIPADMPLGLGTGTFTQTRVPLPAGAIVALFTDGLVETRTRPYDQGVDAMRSLLAREHGDLEHACEALIRGLAQNGEDDITLVLARIPPVAGHGGSTKARSL
jgi:GAF domain-containing protein